jgi:hypothetical protein
MRNILILFQQNRWTSSWSVPIKLISCIFILPTFPPPLMFMGAGIGKGLWKKFFKEKFFKRLTPNDLARREE